MILRHPRIAKDRRLAECREASFNAFEKFLGWFDDFGRGEANPRGILARLWYGRPKVREGTIRLYIRDYERVGLVRRYRVGHVDYLEVVDFAEFVTVPPPSRRRFMACPPPIWAPRGQFAVWKELGERPGKVVVEASGEQLLLDPSPTPPPPPCTAPDTAQPDAGNLPALSVSSVRAVSSVRSVRSENDNNDTPPPPLLAQGGAAAPPEPRVSPDELIAAQVDLAVAYLVRMGGRASRKLRRHMRQNLRDGWPFSEVCLGMVRIAETQLKEREMREDQRLWDWGAGRPVGWEGTWPPAFEAHAPPAVQTSARGH